MGPPADNIVGHYAVTHTVILGGVPASSCPGELDITNQNGSSFSGTISISNTQQCQAVAASGTISGSVTSGGALTFTISITTIDDLLDFFGCEIVGGGETFTGTATTTGLTATRSNELECSDGSGGDAAYTIAGSKT